MELNKVVKQQGILVCIYELIHMYISSDWRMMNSAFSFIIFKIYLYCYTVIYSTPTISFMHTNIVLWKNSPFLLPLALCCYNIV